MSRPFITHSITDDSALGGSLIERSLRFEHSANSVLSRSFSSTGNQRTFTMSAWIKKNHPTNRMSFFSQAQSLGSNEDGFEFDGVEMRFYSYVGGSFRYQLMSHADFRDTNGWYHVVAYLDTTQAVASNRAKFYINGTQITDLREATYPSLNSTSGFFNNSSNGHRIGSMTGNAHRFDGYLADVYFLDGYAYDPSYFGYTESQTGIWRPKRYTGAYGSNGYHLELKDNSSTSTLGTDTSGNGNNFSASNFSVATGSAANIYNNDSVIDTPSDRYATLNALHGYSYNTTFTNGNLFANIPASNTYGRAFGNIPVKSGKWYYEVYYNQAGGNGNYLYVGLQTPDGQTFRRAVRGSDGEQYPNTGPTEVRFATGDIINVAVDLDAGKWYIGRNGTYWYSGNPVAGTGFVHSDLISANATTPIDGLVPLFYNATSGASQQFSVNFGQKPFIYTPPTGYKTINSKNLPIHSPSIIRPQKHFDTVLYTGNGSSNGDVQGISSLEFDPDFVWIKSRSASGTHHQIFDVARIIAGGEKALSPSRDAGEYGFSDFDFLNNGFNAPYSSSAPYSCNTNGVTYAAWCWKAGGNSDTFNIDGVGYGTAAAAGLNGGTANPTGASVNTKKGFSIVTYTGTNNQNVSYSHGLNQAPEMIITKRRDSANNWGVYYTANGTNTNWMTLNTTDAQGSNNSGTTPVGGSSGTFMYLHQDYFAPSYNSFANGGNDGSSNMVAYMWHSVPGYSKFGKYKGNGTTNGAFINLGFRPAWVMIKQTNSTAGWMIYDSERSPSNQINKYFQANSSNAEVDSTTDNPIDFLSNGMKMRYNNTATNQNNGTYIYMAFAEQPGLTPYDTQTNAR